jgi:hypothetical protein
LEYHVLRLAVVDEQLEIPPKWLSRAKYILNAYCRKWNVFTSSHVVSALVPRRLVSSSLAQMSLAKLWFLRDILEHGRKVSEDEANAFTRGPHALANSNFHLPWPSMRLWAISTF